LAVQRIFAKLFYGKSVRGSFEDFGRFKSSVGDVGRGDTRFDAVAHRDDAMIDTHDLEHAPLVDGPEFWF